MKLDTESALIDALSGEATTNCRTTIQIQNFSLATGPTLEEVKCRYQLGYSCVVALRLIEVESWQRCGVMRLKDRLSHQSHITWVDGKVRRTDVFKLSALITSQ